MKETRKVAEVNGFANAFGCIPDEILNEHIWVTGGSGSGKTALILALLVSPARSSDERSGPSISRNDEGAGR